MTFEPPPTERFLMADTLATPDVLARADADTGEGPVIDARSGLLAWVDIPRGGLYLTDRSTGETTVRHYPTMLGAIAPRMSSGWAAAVKEGFAYLGGTDGGDSDLDIADLVLPDPERRMNDAKCDERGRMWAGSTTMTFVPGAGQLHCWDGAGPSRVVRTGMRLPNGIGWSPDGRHLYVVDSFASIVHRATFDLDDGAVGEFEPFYSVPAGEIPDGLCVDSDGCLWLAMWGGFEVRRLSPAGQLIATLPVPVPQPSSCALDDAGTLYVTSARSGLDEATLAAYPESGSVFAVAAGIAPVPVAPFAR
jgi:sugar lactone lactonase YvrE